MRRRHRPLLLTSLFAAGLACGGEDGTDPLRPGGSDKPECVPCGDALVRETNLCGPALDACTNDPGLSLEDQIACFDEDGRCYSAALTRSSACHSSCGDQPQANVESCTGGCFTSRASCAEQALRRADACFESCGDPLQCELCDQRGQDDFDACDEAAVGCADACKRTHRGG